MLDTVLLLMFGIVFVFLFYSALFDFAPIIWLWYRLFPGLKRKRDKRKEDQRQERMLREQENALREQEQEQRDILYRLGLEFQKVFSVDLETIHENTTQDEVVRIVNLLACQTAVACVNQDKVARGVKVEPYHHPEQSVFCRDISWDEATAKLKIEWATTRKLAIQICPELADQMPHFSEFEPLKSYNEEHQLQKKAKRAT